MINLHNCLQLLIKNPRSFFTKVLRRWLLFLPDKQYLQIVYRLRTGKNLNLKNPRSFNEKLQWLKLYDRKPEYTKMVDKFEAKQYVAGIIGEEYIIPTLGVWDKFEDIDFSQLPDKFVLKCTHDSGGLVMCTDKSKLDLIAARKKLNKCLRTNYYRTTKEWPYKDVKPRIIAEQYMTDEGIDDTLDDFKEHNFNGTPHFVLLCQDSIKTTGLTESFFTGAWEHIDVKSPHHRNAALETARPKELNEMLRVSEMLSKDIPLLRTDFYTINKKVFFGEFNFVPSNGFEEFEIDKYDGIIGNWLQLPIATAGGVILVKDNTCIFIRKEKKKELRDYKFFCFDGEPKIMFVATDRPFDTRFDYFDMNFHHLPFVSGHPNAQKNIKCPSTFKKMQQVARKLSKGFPHIRVDLYDIAGHIYFGELSFYHNSGFFPFKPEEWDYKIGSWLHLPKKI